MPVYIRKVPTEMPEPSDAGRSDDEEDSFLRDPEQFQDRLPQPYRMIDKVLNKLFDKAWDVISEREASRIAQGSKKKNVLNPTAEVKLQEKANCLSRSADGKYVFLGHSRGLSVISISSLICVATWEDQSLEITSLSSSCLGEATHLLSTVDDMGVSRIFAFCPDVIYLIKSINETDDISQRKVYTKFQLSEGGKCAAAVIECNGASWLEIYRFPTETWLKELEVIQAASQKQVPHSLGVGEVKFSPFGIIMKIKPPRSLSGTSLKSPFEVLQRTEDGNVIGSGKHHMIRGRQWEDLEAVFKWKYGNILCENKCKAKEAGDRSSQCTFHFLLPGGLTPSLGETEAQSGLSRGFPVTTICVWWSGSHNLFHYTLSKTVKDKADIEPNPDAVWPNAHHIICSATSRCTVYVSLGLVDGTVTIWDRCLGIPWSVVALSDSSSMSGILFLDQPKSPRDVPAPFGSKVCILVTCKSGTCHLITARRGRDSHTTKITERTTDHGTLSATVWSGHVLQKLVLFMYRNGEIIIQDMSNGADVYNLALPPSHCVAPQWSPVCQFDSTRQTLFVQGDRSSCGDYPSESEDTDSSLFVFRLPESSVTDENCTPLSGAAGAKREKGCVSLEETFNLYLQERSIGQA
ncbi:WD repeat-containing protein 93 [Conger conger]|uniref:WD repeat-containing protein 93 n=1 Tax=Conger conger TaxID=82655 RepID=UPI002A5A48A9|nr:WD repeat-containing protein 93 [Conger conger]XP_061102374.1 WD repeat-containing protein 93 [Conger conger]XP_061102376.1 WD repeat-containing protein 93 [Conger conger]XP_061102377.1 WD repeat-containing protein 93 [Conger conger]XP_061102378.1 WD repeat-containing protein 93 [Conger conger]XP_061102379.1 WD repeat-containing protein 93 [Conger conger]